MICLTPGDIFAKKTWGQKLTNVDKNAPKQVLHKNGRGVKIVWNILKHFTFWVFGIIWEIFHFYDEQGHLRKVWNSLGNGL